MVLDCFIGMDWEYFLSHLNINSVHQRGAATCFIKIDFAYTIAFFVISFYKLENKLLKKILVIGFLETFVLLAGGMISENQILRSRTVHTHFYTHTRT